MKLFVLKLIRFYQKYLSLDTGWLKSLWMTDKARLDSLDGVDARRVCRFTPTCSEYTYQAIDRYGIITGLWIGLKRIIRCHPGSSGGSDPVPTSI